MEDQPLLAGSLLPLTTDPSPKKSSLLSDWYSRIFSGQKDPGVELASIGYTELLEAEQKFPPDHERFFYAVALALFDRVEEIRYDRADDKPTPEQLETEVKKRNLRLMLTEHFEIDFNEPELRSPARKKEVTFELAQKLRGMCATYTQELDLFAKSASTVAFYSDRYWSAFEKLQNKLFELPENAHLTRGKIPGERDSLFFTETPLKSTDKTSIAEYFLALPITNPARQKLASEIATNFQDNALSRTGEMHRLSRQYKKNETDGNEAARLNTAAEMMNYCATKEAIESYLFDETRLSAIYYSPAFSTHFKTHDLPPDRKALFQYLLTRTAEIEQLRKALGEEIHTIFARNPAFSTPEFKRLNDAPVHDETEALAKLKRVEKYCQSPEALNWYVMNTSYQKHLHYLQASSILFSSKTYSLTTLALAEVKATGQERLQEFVAHALKTCREEFPDIELPEKYESLCKKFNGFHGRDEEVIAYRRREIEAEITAYTYSDDAYYWYIKTYLAHPKTLVNAECLELLKNLCNFAVRVWEKTENTKELQLADGQILSEESPHTVDVLAVPGTNPTSYVVLNRFNFNPLGEYDAFCFKQASLAMETLSWIQKTLGPQKYSTYKATISTTHSGCPEIDGTIICELLAAKGIPLSMLVTDPENKNYVFVNHDGCVANLSDVERRTDGLTLTLERGQEGSFSALLSPGNVEDFYQGDFSVELDSVHPSIRDHLTATQPETVCENVTRVDINGKKTSVQIQRDHLQLVSSDDQLVVKRLDDELINTITVGQPFKASPLRTKTDKEIDQEKFDYHWDVHGGAVQHTIRLANTLRRHGEAHTQVDEAVISYTTDIPEPTPNPARPPMPAFAPRPPHVKLADAIPPGFTHKSLPQEEVVPEVVAAPGMKDNGLFKAVAEGLNNVINGTSNVSTTVFYTEEYLREACDNYLINLPEKNWVRAQLNSDPDYAQHFEAAVKKDDKGKGEALLFEEIPLASKKTTYRTYADEVRHTAAQKAKTLSPKIDMEARLLCDTLNNGTQIHILEVQEEDVPNDKGEFTKHKVVQKRYLYTHEGRREVNEHDVEWNYEKTITLIYDKDTDHFESANSYLPRTVLFKVLNGSVHTFLLLNLTLAMSGQGGAALVQIINEGYSVALAGFVGWGALAGKIGLIGYYTFNPFGGLPSTASNLSLKIYNGADYFLNGWRAFHTGNWGWKEDVAPMLGWALILTIPSVFFGSLNGPTLKAFSSTVYSTPGLNDSSFFLALANAASTDAAFRLTCFSSALGNLLSAGPILDGAKRTTNAWLTEGKQVFTEGTSYEKGRYCLSMVGGLTATGIATTGWVNFWDISVNILFPNSGFGIALGIGIMPFISLLGYTATFPLGYKFTHHACDFIYRDGPRPWLKENLKNETPGSIIKYTVVSGVTLVTVGMGGLPNVFQAKTLAHQTGALPIFALMASALTELEGTQMCFLLICNKVGNVGRKKPSNEEAPQQQRTSWKPNLWQSRTTRPRYEIEKKSTDRVELIPEDENRVVVAHK